MQASYELVSSVSSAQTVETPETSSIALVFRTSIMKWLEGDASVYFKKYVASVSKFMDFHSATDLIYLRCYKICRSIK